MVQFHPHLLDKLQPITSITPHPENPNEGDVDVIVESMMTNGVYKGVTVQKSTRYILEGEHRYQALLKLGSEVIPVSEVDVDDDTARRILLVDNSSAERAERLPHQVHAVMTRVIEAQDSLVGTGYTRNQYAELSRMLRVIEHAPLKVEAPNKIAYGKIVIRFDEEGRRIPASEVQNICALIEELGYQAQGGIEVV